MKSRGPARVRSTHTSVVGIESRHSWIFSLKTSEWKLNLRSSGRADALARASELFLSTYELLKRAREQRNVLRGGCELVAVAALTFFLLLSLALASRARVVSRDERGKERERDASRSSRPVGILCHSGGAGVAGACGGGGRQEPSLRPGGRGTICTASLQRFLPRF